MPGAHGFAFLAVIAVLLAATASGPDAAAQESADAAPCQQVRGNGALDWYPVHFFEGPKGPDRRAVGVAVDVARTVLEELGLRLEAGAPAPWPRSMEDLLEGRLDVLLGAYWTADRAQRLVYSAPIYREEIAVFVRRDQAFSLESLADLKDRRGLRPMGGSYGEHFDAYAREHLEIDQVATVSTQDEVILHMLNAGRADYVVLARADGRRDLGETGLTDRIVDLEQPVAVNNVHLLFGDRSHCAARIDEIDREIARLEENGTLERIARRYRGARYGDD